MKSEAGWLNGLIMVKTIVNCGHIGQAAGVVCVYYRIEPESRSRTDRQCFHIAIQLEPTYLNRITASYCRVRLFHHSSKTLRRQCASMLSPTLPLEYILEISVADYSYKKAIHSLHAKDVIFLPSSLTDTPLTGVRSLLAPHYSTSTTSSPASQHPCISHIANIEMFY